MAIHNANDKLVYNIYTYCKPCVALLFSQTVIQFQVSSVRLRDYKWNRLDTIIM